MELSIHVCAHKAPRGAEGSVDGKQKKSVCDQGGARDQLPLCYPISTQNSESENYDFGLSLPGCQEGIFFNEGKIKLSLLPSVLV